MYNSTSKASSNSLHNNKIPRSLNPSSHQLSETIIPGAHSDNSHVRTPINFQQSQNSQKIFPIPSANINNNKSASPINPMPIDPSHHSQKSIQSHPSQSDHKCEACKPSKPRTLANLKAPNSKAEAIPSRETLARQACKRYLHITNPISTRISNYYTRSNHNNNNNYINSNNNNNNNSQIL